jgi:hypothetical protein
LDINKYEYKFIVEIVKCITNNISSVSLHAANYPDGLKPQVQQVKLFLDKGSDDWVHMVELCGINQNLQKQFIILLLINLKLYVFLIM